MGIDKKEDIFNQYIEAGIHGFNSKFGNSNIGVATNKLIKYATKGLELGGEESEARNMEIGIQELLKRGSMSDKLVRMNFSDVATIKDYLVDNLRS